MAGATMPAVLPDGGPDPEHWIGLECGPHVAPERVDRSAVRRFCELVEDDDPRYVDGDVAPPGSLMIWCMPPLWAPPGAPWVPSAADRVYRRIPLPGSELVVRSVETTFHDDIRVGDLLSYVEVVTAFTPKTTRVGPGHFITAEQRYRREDGSPVATQSTTVFRYG
jgi:hypothetical protein